MFRATPRPLCLEEKGGNMDRRRGGEGYLKGQVRYTHTACVHTHTHTHTHTAVPLLPSLSLMKGVSLLMGRLSRASPRTAHWRVQGPLHLSP